MKTSEFKNITGILRLGYLIVMLLTILTFSTFTFGLFSMLLLLMGFQLIANADSSIFQKIFGMGFWLASSYLTLSCMTEMVQYQSHVITMYSLIVLFLLHIDTFLLSIMLDRKVTKTINKEAIRGKTSGSSEIFDLKRKISSMPDSPEVINELKITINHTIGLLDDNIQNKVLMSKQVDYIVPAIIDLVDVYEIIRADRSRFASEKRTELLNSISELNYLLKKENDNLSIDSMSDSLELSIEQAKRNLSK